MAATSPCTSLCIIDEATGLCRGCGRTLDEIVGWGALGEAERRAVMDRLPERLAMAPPDAAGAPDTDP